MARDAAWSSRKSVLGLLLFFTLVLGFSCLTICSEFECVDDELLRTIVTIWDGDTYLGTGFFFSPHGYILTNAHVVVVNDTPRDNLKIRLLDGTRVAPSLVDWIYEVEDQGKDLAVLKVDVEEPPFLWLGNSDKSDLYQGVHTLGYPDILVNTIPQEEIGLPTGTTGEITRFAATLRLYSKVTTDIRVYSGLTQFSADSFSGCSGGPVMDEECKVVGVNVVGFNTKEERWDPKYNFFIPINVAITSIIGVDILPPYAPEITSLLPPEVVKSDGNPYVGKIGFRDLNANVGWADIKLLKGDDVDVPSEVYAEAQGQQGKRVGELKYTISTEKQQDEIELQVQLVDGRGERSDPKKVSISIIDPLPHTPVITFFNIIPGSITACGQEANATVGFEDPDGDITKAIVGLIDAQGQPFQSQPLSFNLRDYPSDNPVYDQLEGEFDFLIEATVTAEGTVNLVLSGSSDGKRQEFHVPLETAIADGVTVKVLLSDSRGHISEPKEKLLVIEQPEVDLVASFLEPPPEYLRVGESLNVTYRVQNTGEIESGPFRTTIYLSEDAAIGAEEKDLSLASKEQSNLASGASFTEHVTVVLTQDLLDKNNLQVGPLYLGVVTDDRNDVPERDETNNAQTCSLIVDPIPCTVPDEFPTIQAAIDNAQIDTITIAPGEYIENLHISRSLSLKGAGQERTVIKGKDKVGHPVIYIGSDSDSGIDVHLDGLELTEAEEYSEADYCADADVGFCPHGLYVQGNVSASVQNCTISDNPGYGILIEATARVVLANNQISGNGMGGVKIDNSEATLQGNLIADNKASGIYIDFSTVTIDNSEILNNGDNGIYATDNSRVEVINGNEILGNDNCGIHLSSSSVKITGHNKIARNAEDGLYAESDSTVEINTFNKLISNGRDGIAVDSSSVVSSDNLISDNKRYGIWVVSGSEGTITGTEITGNARFGISVSSSTADISNNKILHNVGPGILGKSADVHITNNEIFSNYSGSSGTLTLYGRGIELDDESMGTVTGNTISDNDLQGIYLSESTETTISDNEITGNGQYGILLRSSQVSISGNVISQNVGPGILGFSSHVEVTNNKIASNHSDTSGTLTLYGRGIELDDESMGTITGNTISDNDLEGIRLSEAKGLAILCNDIMRNNAYGIFVVSSSKVEISANTISKNTTAGIYCGSSSVEILENCITDTRPSTEGKFGMGIETDPASSVTIAKNRLVGNSNDGILVNDSNGQINENYVIGNGRNGINVIMSKPSVSISSNTVLCNMGAGIQVAIESEGPKTDTGINGNVIATNQIGLEDTGYAGYWDLENLLFHNIVANNQEDHRRVTPASDEVTLQEAVYSHNALLEKLAAIEEEVKQLESGEQIVASETLWSMIQILQSMLGDIYCDNGFKNEAIVRYRLAVELDRQASVTWQAKIKKAKLQMNPKVVSDSIIVEPPSSNDLLDSQWFVVAGGRPESFNPYTMTNRSTQLIVDLLHAGLTETNPITREVEPAVAEAWEVSPDFTSYTFSLRDLYFSDGEKLTAQDVLFTFEDIILNPEANITNDYGPDRFKIGNEIVIESVEALDDRTVRFNLRQPFAPFLRMLDVPILPEHLVTAKANETGFEEVWTIATPPNEIAGLGAFKLKPVQSTPGESVVLERNPFYWKVDTLGNRLPYADNYTVMFLDDPYSSLIAKNIDTLWLNCRDMEDLEEKADEEGIQVVVGGPQLAYYYFALNQDVADEDLREIFCDARFRRAISHAIDRESIVEKRLLGYAVAQYGPVYKSSLFHTQDAVIRYEFNLDRTRELLDELGLTDIDEDGIRELPDGRDLEFEIMTGWGQQKAICGDITSDLEKIGIKTTIKSSNTDEIFKTLAGMGGGSYEATFWGWGGTTIDPNSDTIVFSSDGNFHFYRMSDGIEENPPTHQRKIDEILHAQAIETDETVRRQLLAEFQEVFTEHQDLIFIVSPLHLAAAQENIANFANSNTISGIGPVEAWFKKAR